MANARGFGRLGMLAVGLGFGAAVASTPGIASADTPATDPFSWLAGLDPGEAAALPAASPFDLDISVDGFTLLDLGTGASATSGMGDIAIAVGTGASATSGGASLLGISLGSGFGDVAFAEGTNSTADAGVLGGANFDFVFANGANSFANAELGANLDIVGAVGTGSNAEVALGDTFDTAFADGTNSNASIGLGSNDLALANGTDSNATAGVGNGDFASAVGGGNANADGFLTTAFANGTNTVANTAGILDGASVSGTNAEAQAINGIFDSASVINTGSAFDEAFAGGPSPTFPGDSFDIATGSTAFAGGDPTTTGDFDLAIVLGDMLHAIATGANFLFDIPL
jgi:hypothetical protein